jgi:tRNA A37 threonylcarbamoyladenosine synthetase subunit TsaC/SUA5/YrdC
LSSTLILPGESSPLDDVDEIRAKLGKRVDLIVESGSCGTVPTTVVDLTTDVPVVTRQGKGAAALTGELVGA